MKQLLLILVMITMPFGNSKNEAKDAKRWSDVTTITTAVVIHQIDHYGAFFGPIAELADGEYVMLGKANGDLACRNASQPYLSATELCGAVSVPSDGSDCINLRGMGTEYISNFPMDPKTGTDLFSRYYISRSSVGAITIGACDASEIIEVTR
jgi:hypothetical protein